MHNVRVQERNCHALVYVFVKDSLVSPAEARELAAALLVIAEQAEVEQKQMDESPPETTFVFELFEGVKVGWYFLGSAPNGPLQMVDGETGQRFEAHWADANTLVVKKNDEESYRVLGRPDRCTINVERIYEQRLYA